MKKQNPFVWMFLAALVFLPRCSQKLSAASHTVEFNNFAFTPADLKVKVGDTVTFTNRGGFHTVTGTGTDPLCGDGQIPISCQRTFTTPGTFPYRCIFHTGQGMTGKITVEDVPVEKPNVVPFRLNGWSDRLVVTRSTGGNISDPDFFSDQDIWVDWAIANISLTAGIPNRFFTELVLDGVSKASWFHEGLTPDTFNKIEDYNLGQLPVGEHVLTLVTDHTSVVDESNESDNSYSVNVRVIKRPGASHIVEYGKNGANVFTPAELTVNVGDTVVFLHATGFHTITGTTPAEPFCGNDAIPSACTVTFNNPGTFSYRCLFHPGMAGAITVRGSLSLEAAAHVEGPYEPLPSAAVNAVDHTVTVSLPVNRTFWRLRADTALRITEIRVVASTIVLRYEE
ncbi:MAG: hypothetical protein JNN07_26160 [Verrucomicrobiales bacterium]|nr:hypothetical protein [Verrucomicrobiales bacterium]